MAPLLVTSQAVPASSCSSCDGPRSRLMAPAAATAVGAHQWVWGRSSKNAAPAARRLSSQACEQGPTLHQPPPAAAAQLERPPGVQQPQQRRQPLSVSSLHQLQQHRLELRAVVVYHLLAVVVYHLPLLRRLLARAGGCSRRTAAGCTAAARQGGQVLGCCLLHHPLHNKGRAAAVQRVRKEGAPLLAGAVAQVAAAGRPDRDDALAQLLEGAAA
jgi:hypothetical protein